MFAKRRILFGTTILAGVLAAGASAYAQSGAPLNQAPGAPDDQAAEVDEIVVTGSRIRRDPTNAPTPLIQVEREALLTTGQSTVIDYLATIPALSNSVVPSDTTGSGLGDGGLSLPNLRSLGSNRTLTLVDGRRHVGSNGGSLSVDVDTIPRLLIESVEIVTGGASAVYGADAVSGVLNFILRDDFEGVEIDANYGMINSDGQANKRISALIGKNFFDDRLNLWAHGEYEDLDKVQSLDIDWLEDATLLIGTDADPTATPYDGVLDATLFSGLRRLDRPRWGQTTLAHGTQASPLNDPDIAYTSACGFTGIGSFSYNANCYAVQPGSTFWYDGPTARLANFGQRIGNTGISRPYNIGGDGENPATFSSFDRFPGSESQRFAAGGTFKVTDNIELYGDAKYIKEDTVDVSQPTFFDVDLVNSYAATSSNPIYAVNNFDLRWSDNAFLPQLVKDAIRTNVLVNYTAPTATAPGAALPGVVAQLARHSMFGPDRAQSNTRELTRFVAGVRGDYDRFAFFNDISWDIGMTYGEVEVENIETAVDSQRFAWAADAVVDTAGLVGAPGQVVCRVQLLAAQGLPVSGGTGGPDVRGTPYGDASINECQPLNIFGNGNQSAEALEYVYAEISPTERNEQEQYLASVSSTLWDFWGAGRIGVALGYEHRREYTEAVGRDADTAGREWLFLNTGADFPGSEYESDEVFAELSVPLLRDSFLGEYAELSGSYRYADYSTVGNIDVYGVNLVYRPIRDITFKASYNSSVRVPDLGENFSPYSQTFANSFADPCATTAINAAGLDADIRANRIANCTALADLQGLTFDFAGATATNVDDFNPQYTSGIAGVLGGNPFLEPEESTSKTLSVVLEPRFFPNLSIVLDYYEIEIEQVIASVSASQAAANCVSGTTLNAGQCATIFRNNPTIPFGIGAPVGDPIGGFIQGSVNYAKLETRGLDFTGRYSFDFEQMTGRDLGRIDYSIGGLWLIDQQDFLNPADLNSFVENASRLYYPRVRFTSSLTYAPTEALSVNWTVDWQTAQDEILSRTFVLNADSREYHQINTENFARHDFTVRWNVREDLSLRAGVVNAFDDHQAPWLGTTLYSNFDPYGRRFFIGLNFRPW